MKIAVYFSGRIKTYERLLDFLKNLQRENDLDYFCSINGEKDEYHETFLNELQVKHSFFGKHEKEYQEDWFDKFKRLPCDHPHVWYKISSSLWNNKRAFELIEECQQTHAIHYDLVMKFRADLIPHENFLFPSSIEENTVYIPQNHDCPYHWDDPYYHVDGINDHIAYGDLDVMKRYSNVYEKVDQYCSNGRPYHPESLLLHHLETERLNIQRFPYRYWFHGDRHHSDDAFYHPKE